VCGGYPVRAPSACAPSYPSPCKAMDFKLVLWDVIKFLPFSSEIFLINGSSRQLDKVSAALSSRIIGAHLPCEFGSFSLVIRREREMRSLRKMFAADVAKDGC